MMKTVAFFGIVALLVAHAPALLVPSPAVAWSNFLDYGSLAELETQTGGEVFKTQLQSSAGADVLCFFISDSLRTDRFRSGVETIAERSSHSIRFPYVHPFSTTDGLYRWVEREEPCQLVKVASLQEYKQALERISSKAQDSGTDCFVFELPDESAEQDRWMERVQETLEARENELSYANLFLADHMDNVNIKLDFQSYEYRRFKRAVLDDSEPATYDNRWPAGVLEGIFFGSIFLFTTFLGFLCTAAIQTPEKFDKPNAKRIVSD